ncbi:aminomethyl-transferring glycine dehydrogenase subunit GcvPB [Clostridia bacterium OttesenSCG-928-O13]|nr:aminomethyl-transferring glycine dehydrogenase subunit GcvPB [Clostridia bacterium OttesenSCG-928-O13]
MELLFEKSVKGRSCTILPALDVPAYTLPKEGLRQSPPALPELSETDVSRHYSALERRTHGVNNGFYPLGSCTMKYNPRVNEVAAALPGFTDIHPLQPDNTVQGALEVLHLAEKYLGEITGMDAMTFQPAAGAHGELTGVMLIKKYHQSKGDFGRTKIIVPDSAHGTNPATAVMCGMTVINIPSGEDGCVDLDKLREAVGKDTAGLMLTNPNTLGIFEKDILEITKIVHDAGGLVYYDGANLNAIMGVIRPGDMGFDCVHLNLHKTFSTPHGGGGPGSGAVGCKAFLQPFLPRPQVEVANGVYKRQYDLPSSIGKVKEFSGNFLVTLKALVYIITLGRAGIADAAKNAVLNANYMMKRLSECYTVANKGICMHEFVVTLEKEAKEKEVTAKDIAKALLDYGIHPPTMYFPLIVHEALMVEPTETEGKEMLDEAADVFIEIYKKAMEDPEWVHSTPQKTPIGRPDEVTAARSPILRYQPQ